MLRIALLLAGAGLLAAGLYLRVQADPGWLSFVVPGAVLLLATLLERWRYRGAAAASGETGLRGWERLDEQFVDPGSGQTVQVLYNPRTGERRYEPLPTDRR